MTRDLRRVLQVAALAAAATGLAASVAGAQTSSSYKLTESTINSGGDPVQGSVLASAHFRVRLDAIGDGVVGTGLGSASFRVDQGFVLRIPPPGEVTGLLFSDKSTLVWSPERSVGTYDVYRDLLATLPGGFGSCLASDVTSELATDVSVPPQGQGYFYLVTARNRLREEGTKGLETGGSERGNPNPCP